MNELSLFNQNVTEKLVTTKELAEQLNTSSKVILENARKCLPSKIIENGKITYWNKAEITILIDTLKNNTRTNDSDLYLKSKGEISTELTPALKIHKAMLMMKEAYDEEIAILEEKNRQQQKQLEEQQPKVDFFDTVTKSDDTFDMSEVAKILNLGIGRNKLYEILRSKNILRANNEPYQQFVNAGYFKIVESTYVDLKGATHIGSKTVVYQKGLDYIRKIVAKTK